MAERPAAARPPVQVEGLAFGHPGAARWRLAAAAWSGGMVGLSGPSGSGKSTLLRVLAGLHPVDAGRVWVAGQPVHGGGDHAALRARWVALVPQEPALIDWMSLRDNVRLHAQVAGSVVEDGVCEAILDGLGLGALAGRRAAALSGGERQRAGLARALLSPARVILADEPTAGLDPEAAGRVLGALAARGARPGHLVVVASHRPAVLGRCAPVCALAGLRVGAGAQP